jgi:hypothetical protein
VDHLSDSHERRAHPRYAVDAAATLVVVNQGATFSGRLFDVSLDGCGVCTNIRQPFPAPVLVEITFKIDGIGFRLGGMMERTGEQNVVGVRFGPMALRRREALLELLAELETKELALAALEASQIIAPEEGQAEFSAQPAIQNRLSSLALPSKTKSEIRSIP